MIAPSGGTVSIAPPVELQMGHGMPAFAKMRARAIVPSLSVDIETNQPGDMFTPMRATFQLQRSEYECRPINSYWSRSGASWAARPGKHASSEAV